jgi:Xaa-Pro aminopeptidase
MIFAMGRDGGFPHSRGDGEMALRTGQAIVFDIFPRELGGGYHHDMTRTWCIGYAPPEVQQAYDDVMTAFDVSLEAFGVGKPTNLMQEAAQDYLEGKGHPTARSHPGTTVGYVHSLGHGLGLQVHEGPRISHKNPAIMRAFEVGNVVTIEPGRVLPR